MGDYWITVGSVAELEKLTGVKMTDLHREHVDQLTFDDPRGPEYGKMRRVEEVFDCWFESGSMPYGSAHYPFAWKGREEEFLKQFPATFVAEGLDQTRGWFYTLMVVASALFEQPAFKNVIVNGLVLAEDGKKMSKSKKNYPDPMLMLNKYGADAVRLYLVNSPAVRAEPVKFKEAELYEVVKDVFLTWYNVYRFFVENATRFESESGRPLKFNSEPKCSNLMNKWLLSRLQTCVKAVRAEFESYKLYAVLPNLLSFLGEVSHWYVQMNREHLRGQKGEQEAEKALQTLYVVLQSLCTLMAPVTPFLTEAMYQNLRNGMEGAEESVHYLRVPEVNEHLSNPELERQVARMMHAVTLGRAARDKSKVSFKVPLTNMVVVHPDQSYLDDVSTLKDYVQKMLNVKSLEFSSKVTSFVKLSATPNNREMGKEFRSNARGLYKVVSELTHEQATQLQADGALKVHTEAGEFTLTTDHVTIECNFCGDEKRFAAVGPDNGLLVALDTRLDEKLLSEGHARNFVSRV